MTAPLDYANIANSILKEIKAKHKMRDEAFYYLRSILGNANWALFYLLLGGRQAGKSYSVTEYFVKQWKKYRTPCYWIRLKENATKKLLSNNAEKLVDPDIRRKYHMDLTTKGNVVYDHGKKWATVLALSTFYSDKGNAMYDKDFLTLNPKKQYLIALDEFQPEKGERSQGDIAYQFVNQLENILRNTKERTKIFLIANTLEEASDILCLFNFIPEEFGRYKLKSKRAVIDYMEPTEAYKKMRQGSIMDLLAPDSSNATNKITIDKSLILKGRNYSKPKALIIFDKDRKDAKFLLYDNGLIDEYKNQPVNNIIAMRPYQDQIFYPELRDEIFVTFYQRCYKFRNLITFKRFQHFLQELKPSK